MEYPAYRFGISTTIDYSVDIFTQLELINKAGFEFISIGARLEHSCFMEPSFFDKVMERAADYEIEIESAHAPFGGEYDLAAKSLAEREKAVELTREFCEVAADYAISTVIVHPHHFFDDSQEACAGRAAGGLERLLATSPPEIKIAVENLPDHRGSWICGRLLDIFGPSRLGFCYDSSHENMSGPAFHILRKYRDRIVTTHLSDNHGSEDEHLAPGEGRIDWGELSELIKESGVRSILFEVGTGEKLREPIETVLKQTIEFADKQFNK